MLTCEDCKPGTKHKGCRVECVKWPNGRGLTATVKSWHGHEQAHKMARSERLLYIAVWPQRGLVHLDLETAGLRFTSEGFEMALQVMRGEAKRLGIRKRLFELVTHYDFMVIHLPVEWVEEQLATVASNPENVECSGFAACGGRYWTEPTPLAADLDEPLT